MSIYEDLKAKAHWLYNDDTLKLVSRAFFSDATLALLLYRGMSLLGQRSVTKPIAYMLHKFNAIFCGCVIGMNAQFGKRLVILHSVGIVINSEVIAGDDVTLESGVVIGAEKGKSPVVGNNVFFGAGSKCLGGISIGNNVLVGANAVVVKSVPDSVVVVGVPARIIRDNDLENSRLKLH